jgi:ubiquinone/menaquinone biosynthesis C-methylase UbiE
MPHSTQEPELGAFTDVDRSHEPEAFVRYLDRVNQTPERRESTRRAVELLELREGDHALDVGCGCGEGLHELVRVVGRTGRVVGVDSSTSMIEAAGARIAATDGPIDLVEASAYALPFANGSFAGCTTGRLLQHLDRPDDAVREMIRVTRSGGRLSIADVDWGTCTVDASDQRLTEKILPLLYRSIRSPRIGRQLHAMLNELGLLDVHVTPRAVVQYDLSNARELFWFDFRSLVQAVADGVVTEGEARAWIADLEKRDRTGRFFAMIVAFVAVGRVR